MEEKERYEWNSRFDEAIKDNQEDIKNVSEFYQALRNNVANTFNDYERCGIFDGWTENQKKECFHFGTHILSNVWLPIQQHYTNKERKKYEKIVNKYEDICKRQDQQIAELKHQLAEKDKEIEELKLNNKKYFTDSCRVNKEYVIAQARDKILETEKDKQIADLQHRLKVADIALEKACDELRSLNYRIFDNADIDFERQFKEQSEKEVKGEKL